VTIVGKFPPPRIRRPRLTEIDFCAWVAQAAPGDRLEYHRGFLAVDTVEKISWLSERDRLMLKDLKRRALHLFEQGLVHLVQERLGPGHFAYFAIARPKLAAANTALSALLLEEPAA
jgi:hypothetical protein